MDDLEGRPLRLAADLAVLGEFWPSLAKERSRLCASSGLRAAEEVMGRAFRLDQEFADTTPGSLRIRIREKTFYPNLIDLEDSDDDELRFRAKEAIALLPLGILDIFSRGADICLATYRRPVKREPTVTRNVDELYRRWQVILGFEAFDAPEAAARGIVVHELLHVVVGKSPSFITLRRMRNSFDAEAAERANSLIEEKVVRLACELGLIEETKRYLLHVRSLYPQDQDGERFLGIVDSYSRGP